MIIYEVHSDVDENNVFTQFFGRGAKQAAIKYAKENEKCWVDKVEYNPNTEDYKYCGGVYDYKEEK